MSFVGASTVVTNLDRLKRSPHYPAAKAGDTDAAFELISEILDGQHLKKICDKLHIYNSYSILPIQAIEASGMNKIPLALAFVMSVATGAPVDLSIINTNKCHHTGASMLERFISYPSFEGNVEKRNYVLVDDVSTGGSTLKACKDFIEGKGGNVVGTFVMAIGREGNFLEPTLEDLVKMMTKFNAVDLTLLLNETGRKNITNLTHREVKLLERFDSVERIREAIAEVRNAKELGAPGKKTGFDKVV